jgi:hypothetical protein
VPLPRTASNAVSGMRSLAAFITYVWRAETAARLPVAALSEPPWPARRMCIRPIVRRTDPSDGEGIPGADRPARGGTKRRGALIQLDFNLVRVSEYPGRSWRQPLIDHLLVEGRRSGSGAGLVISVSRRTPRPGAHFFKPLRQTIESTNQTFIANSTWNDTAGTPRRRHGPRPATHPRADHHDLAQRQN